MKSTKEIVNFAKNWIADVHPRVQGALKYQRPATVDVSVPTETKLEKAEEKEVVIASDEEIDSEEEEGETKPVDAAAFAKSASKYSFLRPWLT